jgi:hypothetical protein
MAKLYIVNIASIVTTTILTEMTVLLPSSRSKQHQQQHTTTTKNSNVMLSSMLPIQKLAYFIVAYFLKTNTKIKLSEEFVFHFTYS